MFDLPPPIEQYCPQETVQLVMDIKRENNHDAMHNLLYMEKNKEDWNPCLDSVVDFLFVTLKGTEEPQYIMTLLNSAINNENYFNKKTLSIIYGKINDIPYIKERHYEYTYFNFLRELKVQPTDAIKSIETSEAAQWEKYFYLAYMGDWEAFENMLQQIRLEDDPKVVLELISPLYILSDEMKYAIITEFENDQRVLDRMGLVYEIFELEEMVKVYLGYTTSFGFL